MLIPLRLVRGKKISEITNISYCEFSHRLNPLELLKNQKISALVKMYLKTLFIHLRQALYFLTLPWVIRGNTQLGLVAKG